MSYADLIAIRVSLNLRHWLPSIACWCGLSLANQAAPPNIKTHELASPFQAGPTTVRVLLPADYSPSQSYRVLYVLPVVAGSNRRFGDGLAEIAKLALHDKHQLICVAPEFTAPPWFADHASDKTMQDESHMLKTVLPFIESHYPVSPGRDGRLLVGFSKSGWGALTLLLRQPNIFHRAAGWDCGIRIDTGPMESADRKQRIELLFGSPERFEAYRLSRLIQKRGAHLGNEERLFYYNTGGRRAAGGTQLHQLMVELEIPHRYVFEPKRPHRWDSGWLPAAVEFLVTPD